MSVARKASAGAEPAEPVAASAGTGATPIVTILLLAGALVLWAWSLPDIDPDAMQELGLVTILPIAVWTSIGLVVLAFVLSLRPSTVRGPLPFLTLTGLILVLHATPAIAYGTLRYSWAWKHLGIVDFIQRHHSLDPEATYLAAYHNWPAFFAAFATIGDWLHLDSLGLSEIARYFPPAMNFLYLLVLPQVFRRFTDDWRLIWLSCGLFLVGNWVGQDYFSPQGSAFLFYLVILAFVLGPLQPVPAGSEPAAMPLSGRIRRFQLWASRAMPEPRVRPGSMLRITSAALVLALTLAIVATHQLTPLLLILALGGLFLLGRLGFGYVLFAIIAEIVWLFYFADAFFSASMNDLVAQFGAMNADMTAKLADLAVVSPAQRIVSMASRGLSAAIVALAVLGGIRRLLAHQVDGAAAALALAPMPLLVMTPYGGEIIFRAYYYALPFLAFFAAALIFPTLDKGVSRLWFLPMTVLTLVLVAGFLLANNGKDRQYRFSPDEVAAADWLYTNAPSGSLLIEGSRNYPSQFRNYERFRYVPISLEPPETRNEILADPTGVLGRWLSEAPKAGYVIITRSQQADVDDLGIMPKGALARIDVALMGSPRFILVKATADARVYALNPVVAKFGRWLPEPDDIPEATTSD